MFKLDLEKAEETEIKLPTSAVSSKKQESSIKTSTFALLTTPKPLTVWTTTNKHDGIHILEQYWDFLCCISKVKLKSSIRKSWEERRRTLAMSHINPTLF